MMLDPKKLEQLAQRIEGILPPGLSNARADMGKNMRAVIASVLSGMDLVTREEFDVQKAVLARTRKHLDELEKRMQELE